MISTCIHCGAVGPTMYGACKGCITPAEGATGQHLDERQQRAKVNAKRRQRTAERAAGRPDTRTPPVVLPDLADVPKGHEARRVVDWVTGRVAGVVAYRRDESASVVEDVHLAACRAAGVWTPAVARAS